MKRTICLILAILLLPVFSICCSAAKEQPKEEQPTVIYEAFFLNNDEILKLFSEVRGEKAPYVNMTKDFHVTTAFMPEKDMRELYGTEVTIHIYAYQNGQVPADDGTMTANEGFFCTITSDNAAMQDYVSHLDNNWHITGSYKDQGGAKYTSRLDLTDAQVVHYTVTGRFGGYLSDNTVTFTPDK